MGISILLVVAANIGARHYCRVSGELMFGNLNGLISVPVILKRVPIAPTPRSAPASNRTPSRATALKRAKQPRGNASAINASTFMTRPWLTVARSRIYVDSPARQTLSKI